MKQFLKKNGDGFVNVPSDPSFGNKNYFHSGYVNNFSLDPSDMRLAQFFYVQFLRAKSVPAIASSLLDIRLGRKYWLFVAGSIGRK